MGNQDGSEEVNRSGCLIDIHSVKGSLPCTEVQGVWSHGTYALSPKFALQRFKNSAHTREQITSRAPMVSECISTFYCPQYCPCYKWIKPATLLLNTVGLSSLACLLESDRPRFPSTNRQHCLPISTSRKITPWLWMKTSCKPFLWIWIHCLWISIRSALEWAPQGCHHWAISAQPPLLSMSRKDLLRFLSKPAK